MTHISIENFIEIAIEKMDVFANEYGFVQSDIKKTNITASVKYKKNEIGIQGNWDLRDQWFSVRLTLLDRDKNFPDVWRINDKEELVSGYISEFLAPKGIRDLGERSNKTKDQFDNEINHFLFLIKNYAPEILSEGSAKNFKAMKVEGGDRF